MLTLIIPAYNEQSIIVDTLRQAKEFLVRHFSEFELLIVDDGSTDKTAEMIKPFLDQQVKLFSYTPNAGKGKAIRTGVLAAQGDYIFYTDADLAYGLEVISQGLALLESAGCDIVLGSRKLEKSGYEHYPPLRKAASKTFSALVRLFSGLPYDTQCGIKGFRKETAVQIFQNCQTNGFAFDFEALMIARRLHSRISQFPVSVINHRESKINVLRDSIRMFKDLLRIRVSVSRRMKEEK